MWHKGFRAFFVSGYCTTAARIDCPKHGTRQVKLPWAETHSCFTTLFERLAIDLLKVADMLSVADILHISWDEVHYIKLELLDAVFLLKSTNKSRISALTKK